MRLRTKPTTAVEEAPPSGLRLIPDAVRCKRSGPSPDRRELRTSKPQIMVILSWRALTDSSEVPQFRLLDRRLREHPDSIPTASDYGGGRHEKVSAFGCGGDNVAAHSGSGYLDISASSGRRVRGAPTSFGPSAVCEDSRVRADVVIPTLARPVTSWAARRSIGAAAATLIAAVLLVAPCGLSTGADLPSAAAQPCPDVEIVFARGTSEPPGIGRVGQALVDTLQPELAGRTLDTYAVNYPASYDFLAAADGAADAAAHIAAMAQQCPSTRIVLGGYSQGAAVVDMLAGIPPLGDKVGEVGSAPPLPSSIARNVAAVAVFGNPSTKFGDPVSASSLFAGKAIDLCSDGDPICSHGRNPFAHTTYETSGYPSQAANFVAALV